MPNPTPNQTGLAKPKWKHLPTEAIRVPQCFSEQIQAIARNIDEGIDITVQRYTENDTVWNKSDNTYQEAIDILENALTLKANAGGKIKDAIRQALELLK
jgi:hypothetical protein